MRAKEKRRLQTDAIASASKLDALKNSDLITSTTDISKLAAKIETGEWKAYDVTLSYIRQAIAAHAKVSSSVRPQDSGLGHLH